MEFSRSEWNLTKYGTKVVLKPNEFNWDALSNPVTQFFLYICYWFACRMRKKMGDCGCESVAIHLPITSRFSNSIENTLGDFFNRNVQKEAAFK